MSRLQRRSAVRRPAEPCDRQRAAHVAGEIGVVRTYQPTTPQAASVSGSQPRIDVGGVMMFAGLLNRGGAQITVDPATAVPSLNVRNTGGPRVHCSVISDRCRSHTISPGSRLGAVRNVFWRRMVSARVGPERRALRVGRCCGATGDAVGVWEAAGEWFVVTRGRGRKISGRHGASEVRAKTNGAQAVEAPAAAGQRANVRR